MASAVMVNMCSRLVQPIKDRVYKEYEMTGLVDPTWESRREVPDVEVCAQMAMFMMLPAGNTGSSKVYSVFWAPLEVSAVI